MAISWQQMYIYGYGYGIYRIYTVNRWYGWSLNLTRCPIWAATTKFSRPPFLTTDHHLQLIQKIHFNFSRDSVRYTVTMSLQSRYIPSDSGVTSGQ